MKRWSSMLQIVSFMVLLGAFQTGCAPKEKLRIESTDGVRACLDGVAEAELLAVNLKNRESAPEVVAAGRLYDDAVVEVRKYLTKVHEDAELQLSVDEPLSKYQASSAKAALDSFLEKEELLPMGVLSLGGEIGEAAATFIIRIIDGIKDQHRKELEASLKRLRRYLQRGEMINFKDTTSDSLKAKYLSGD